jgi:TetR/AcrR family transcriptional regulator, transcriptional repressor of bet genes
MPGKRASEGVRREQILAAAFEVAATAGIGGLTVRAVAAEAGLSHGLVLYHFRSKERLVHDLLGWLVETTPVLHLPDEAAQLPHAPDRLHVLLAGEMDRLARQPRRTRLFFEYWALGVRDESIRACIGAELERYRAALRAIMEELLRADPDAFPGATAEGLAAVAVSWVQGCAVQAMVDPVNFDVDAYLAAVLALSGRGTS